MIKAHHKKWGRFLYDCYFNHQLKKFFGNFFLVNEYPKIPDDLSLVITPNHMSWWDPFFIGYAYNLFTTKKHHVIMLEKQLQKYHFFTKVGAYSIDPGNKESVKATLDYGAEILNKKDNLIDLFPQGILEPYDKTPLTLRKGALTHLAQKSNFMILPVASRIHYSNKKKPDIYMSFGPLLHSSVIINNFDSYQSDFMNNLDNVKTAAYEKIFWKEILRK